MYDIDDNTDTATCTECGGQGYALGYLGSVEWFKCRDCGHQYTEAEHDATIKGHTEA